MTTVVTNAAGAPPSTDGHPPVSTASRHWSLVRSKTFQSWDPDDLGDGNWPAPVTIRTLASADGAPDGLTRPSAGAAEPTAASAPGGCSCGSRLTQGLGSVAVSPSGICATADGSLEARVTTSLEPGRPCGTGTSRRAIRGEIQVHVGI
eukprot:5467711-Prymnesium_polylepis.1